MKIESFKFDNKLMDNLKAKSYGTNWPTVYILSNEKEAYIGETTDVSSRTNQHLANDVRRNLKKVTVITDNTFNKSTILDLESFLIKYMSADNLFKLQNGNKGIQNHNYYQKDFYQNKFKDIWNQLRLKKIVKNDLRLIENSDLFKFSPYKTLTVDQYMIVNNLLSDIANDIENNKTSSVIINGGAGTGKTVLGIYLMKLLTSFDDNIKIQGDEIYDDIDSIQSTFKLDSANIGLVIPMTNLRETLKKVFRSINGLDPKMVLSPNDVAKSKDTYDLLIIDEAHRLRQRKNLTQYGTFDKNNKRFGFGNKGTELDWILEKSKYQIFFYDENQSIKLTDVPRYKFDELLKYNTHVYELETQLRIKNGGNEYVEYIKEIFSSNPPTEPKEFPGYRFKIFNNIKDMEAQIKQHNNDVGLSRLIAGYSWKWNTKDLRINKELTNEEMDELLTKNYDIQVQGNRYIWNTKATDWINSPNSINEVGSIHTIQGYDLNYAGIIIGNELKYDPINRKMFIDKSEYFDVKGKSATSDEDLLSYIINIYTTMLTRGIKGTYLYISDSNLKEYLKHYIPIDN